MAIRMDFESYLSEGADASPNDLIALEDAAGIDVAIVMPKVQLRPDNRWLVNALKGYEKRLIACCSVNPNYGTEAVDEFRTGITEWGMRGLKLMPPGFALNLGSSDMTPIMDLARELGQPVTIHTGGPPGHPLQAAMVARRWPEVPIILDHMGFRDFSGDAIAAADMCPNIYLGLTLVTVEPGTIKHAVDRLGPTRLVFGSNAPSAYPDLGVENIRRLRLGTEAEELILGENLRRIYGLPESR
ncbi:MAG TPA: amidohydrolase family protein [Chloroflexota bacterium]|nr:amidohydrolase family protein [Chloroflexota bacterium]